MRKKTRVIISSLAISALLLIFGFPVLAQSKVVSFMSEWGKNLKEYSVNKTVNEPEVYAKGNSVVVTEKSKCRELPNNTTAELTSNSGSLINIKLRKRILHAESWNVYGKY